MHRAKGAALQVGGLVAFSATDFPGCLSAVVFVQGCPWRCGYCHNPHLQSRRSAAQRGWADVLRWLQQRQGLLDAVVFSGGEPCADPQLAAAVNQVRALGFKVGLHTAGIYPRRLAEVLPLLDWVGLDIKTAPERYADITQVPDSGDAAWECAHLLLASGVAHEFRTTVHPAFHSEASLRALARRLRSLGARHYVLQEFRPTGCHSAELNAQALAALGQSLVTAALKAELTASFECFAYRAA